MTRHRPHRTLLGLVAFLLLGMGCNKDHHSNSLVAEHNAQFNGGRATRWPTLPIRVFLGGAATSDEVTVWTGETAGLVTFAFVGSPGAAGITFGFRSGEDICGETHVEFTDSGEITSADVVVSRSIYRGRQCVRTITHETAHAIGFFDHTSDGGLMDDDGGNGEITPPVSRMLRELYSLAPGTVVSSERRKPLVERRKGRNVMTFIYPVRKP